MYKFLIPLFLLALLVGCTPATDTATDTFGTDSSASSDAIGTDASSALAISSSPSMSSSSSEIKTLTGTHDVVLHTSKGDIFLTLDADAAPKTVTNFIELAKQGYYDNLIFHRVIPGFMIQGGDPSGNGTGGESIYGETFEDEANNLTMSQGAIAMANRGPNTNGSQFFIVEAKEGTPWLQGRHTIFGKVTKGMDVVSAIVNVQRDASDMPATPITYTVEVVK
jgi:peptidyl-prolyl cis-trans isomerase B (cyclophilin B)